MRPCSSATQLQATENSCSSPARPIALRLGFLFVVLTAVPLLPRAAPDPLTGTEDNSQEVLTLFHFLCRTTFGISSLSGQICLWGGAGKLSLLFSHRPSQAAGWLRVGQEPQQLWHGAHGVGDGLWPAAPGGGCSPATANTQVSAEELWRRGLVMQDSRAATKEQLPTELSPTLGCS